MRALSKVLRELHDLRGILTMVLAHGEKLTVVEEEGSDGK